MGFEDLPICVLSFDRPGYLRRTLAGLAAARQAAGHRGPVALMQDGAVNRHSGQRKAAEADIAACVVAFREAFPQGEVLAAPDNLGIGRNMARAEHWALADGSAPAALTFEDDLVPAPHYLRAMRGLYGLAAAEPRIAMFAAYGSDGLASPEVQRAGRQSVAAMHHNWGFGLTRAAWLQRRALTDAYDALLAGCDYRDRPLDGIAAWYASLGWPPLPTSQDIARAAALNTLGLVRVCSVSVCARYIGEVGQHYTPEEFRRLRFGATVLGAQDADDADWTFPAPGAAQLDAILAEQRRELLSQRLGRAPFLADPRLLAILRAARAADALGLLAPAAPLAAAGLHPDGWCGPQARFAAPAKAAVVAIALEGLAASHLPPGATLALSLNGAPAATVALHPGVGFAARLEVPAALAGLETVLAADCTAATDGFAARVNQDRRPLAFRLLRFDLDHADGARTHLTGETLAATLLGGPHPNQVGKA